MTERRLGELVSVCVIASMLVCMPGSVCAQGQVEREGVFVVGVAGGYAWMNVAADNRPGNPEGAFAFGIRGGYAITRDVFAGMELNGWTLNTYDMNDPSRGESISNVSAVINYFPMGGPVYFTAGIGKVAYTNNSPAVSGGREQGDSWFVGGGYEFPISRDLTLAPQIRYVRGDFTGGNFSAYEITLGVNWYLGN